MATKKTASAKKKTAKKGSPAPKNDGIDPAEYASGLRELAEKLAEEDYVINYATISRILRQNRKTAPKRHPVQGWKVSEMLKWLEARDASLDEDDDEELKELKKEKLRSEIDLRRQHESIKELEYKERKGDLITAAEVLDVVGNMIRSLVAGMVDAKHQLAPRLAGADEIAAGQEYMKVQRALLEGMAVPTWAQKKTFWRTVSDGCSDHLRTVLSGTGASAM